jgi:hypothetical protein
MDEYKISNTKQQYGLEYDGLEVHGNRPVGADEQHLDHLWSKKHNITAIL